MIIGIGIDIVEVERIAAAIERYGEQFLRRVYTETERAYCERAASQRFLHYAARFAAKEAFSKAIGTGLRHGFRLCDCGVVHTESGQPQIALSGILAERWGKYPVHLSLSHTRHYAAACVIIEAP
ncbi:MAG: holo-ACP synthase [Bacteroidota bacterium]|nr:holo-ACP synthase [Candidatus Kapabacteria bacterium]MCS7302713.1 holo-ACP synthase [Candidatus Kapabacteria bacterium]MCX7937070.1 holo-ACP synthase [Chlorobiota bacterium]MDW8075169.1 holo-ACP synthase [Bacteroidota bacterium]MDW8272400.1 holo-ACP synthase [Bacteroidota bacterium]